MYSYGHASGAARKEVRGVLCRARTEETPTEAFRTPDADEIPIGPIWVNVLGIAAIFNRGYPYPGCDGKRVPKEDRLPKGEVDEMKLGPIWNKAKAMRKATQCIRAPGSVMGRPFEHHKGGQGARSAGDRAGPREEVRAYTDL